jgi:FkbM family methyltransferase
MKSSRILPVVKVLIANARWYFLKRAFIHAAIKFPILARLIRLFNKNQPDLSVLDVEQIFFICRCEREAENILMIRNLVGKLDLREHLDIGSNFGQFAAGVSDLFEAGLCLDANPAAVEFLESLPELDAYQRVNRALVPKGIVSDFITLKIPAGNTGKALIGELPDDDYTEVVVKTTTVAGFSALSVDPTRKRFVKFDIEGLEPELVSDYLELGRTGDVVAFEVLTQAAKDRLNAVFSSYNEKYQFITLRYSFLHDSGFMGDNKLALLKMYLTGCATMDVYKADYISDFPFGFMSLVFAIPEKYMLDSLLDMNTNAVRL